MGNDENGQAPNMGGAPVAGGVPPVNNGMPMGGMPATDSAPVNNGMSMTEAMPVVEQTAPATEQAVPVTKQTAPAATPKVNKKPMIDTSKKSGGVPKGAIIGIVVGVIVVIVIVLGVIFIPMLFEPDYEDANKKMEAFRDAIQKVDIDSCNDMSMDINDEDESNEDFAKTVSKCQDDIKAMDEAFKALGASTGVKNDKENKEIFDKVKKSYDIIVPKMNELTEISKATHTLVVTMYKHSTNLEKFTDEDIDSATKDMTNSSIGILKEHGPKLNSALKSYVKSYKSYQKAIKDTSVKYEKYKEIRDEFYDEQKKFTETFADFSKAMEENYSDALEDEVDTLKDLVYDLEDKISDKYLEAK